MDDLIFSALNAAALRPDGDTHCYQHPERPATSTLYGIPKCKECVAADHAIYQRAFGTGTGTEAHAEAQESGAMQREYDQLKPPKYEIIKGGKPV